MVLLWTSRLPELQLSLEPQISVPTSSKNASSQRSEYVERQCCALWWWKGFYEGDEKKKKPWMFFCYQFCVQGKEVAILFDYRFFLPEWPIINCVTAFLADVWFLLLKMKDDMKYE